MGLHSSNVFFLVVKNDWNFGKRRSRYSDNAVCTMSSKDISSALVTLFM